MTNPKTLEEIQQILEKKILAKHTEKFKRITWKELIEKHKKLNDSVIDKIIIGQNGQWTVKLIIGDKCNCDPRKAGKDGAVPTEHSTATLLIYAETLESKRFVIGGIAEIQTIRANEDETEVEIDVFDFANAMNAPYSNTLKFKSNVFPADKKTPVLVWMEEKPRD